MRKALFVLAIVGAAPGGALGQTLQDQINSVYQAQQQDEARQRAAYDAQQAELGRERQQQLSAEEGGAALPPRLLFRSNGRRKRRPTNSEIRRTMTSFES